MTEDDLLALLARIVHMTPDAIVDAVVATGQDIWDSVFQVLHDSGDKLTDVYAIAVRAGYIKSGPSM
ncbi:MAG: hypothetical protein HY565_00995 [Candidatus Kerfeldbacteria bacterium]|nr:hypothetical protein [Candidatus Kerfeldbacteria bacterium]